MTLNDAINMVTNQYMRTCQMTDIVIGTITAVDPLEVRVNGMSDTLRAPVLYLTANVVEKKIPILEHSHGLSGLAHSHTVSGLSHTHDVTVSGDEGEYSGSAAASLGGSYGTSTALSRDSAETDSKLLISKIVCVENGQQLPVKDGYIILNRALEIGDKVIMIRVQNGQRFIILSRVYEEMVT